MNRRTRLRWLLVAVGTAALILWLVRFSGFDEPAYREALQDPNYQGKLAHFPNTFSSELTPVSFDHSWPLLQGGGHLQLLCRSTDPKRIWDTQRFAYQNAGIGSPFLPASTTGGESRPLVRLEQDGRSQELGPAWQIGVIAAEPGKGHDRQPWNHGDTRGIAINTNEHLVLFWAETW